MVDHDTAGWATIQATTRPREATIPPAGRARGLAGGLCHDTQFCIVTEARGWPLGDCVTIQSLYRDRWAIWLVGVSRYNRLYRDRRGLGNWLCRDTMLRHGREGTTLRCKRRATWRSAPAA